MEDDVVGLPVEQMIQSVFRTLVRDREFDALHLRTRQWMDDLPALAKEMS